MTKVDLEEIINNCVQSGLKTITRTDLVRAFIKLDATSDPTHKSYINVMIIRGWIKPAAQGLATGVVYEIIGTGGED